MSKAGVLKPDIPHPDDFARTLRDVVGEKDRNKRAQAARRALSAYTTLFYTAAQIQQESREVSEENVRLRDAGRVLAEPVKAAMEAGLVIPDPERPLTMEDMAA